MIESATHDYVSVPDDVLVQLLPDEECVFLNLATEQYFGLGPTGSAMWRALVETGRVQLACQRLAAAFDVDREVMAHDLDALVQQLARRGLLRLGAHPG